MKDQRSMLLFEQTIKSKYTLRNYREHLKRFLEFTKLKDHDSLLKLSKDDIQIQIEDYVMYLKKAVNPNSVDTMMRGIKHFFVINKVGLYWELIRKLYPEKVKSSGFMPFTTKDVQSMLDATTSKRNKAIIHFLASTGSRIGVFDYDLSMKHLKDMGSSCMAVLIYADEKDEYWSFLTPEATNSLNDYFQQRQDDGEKFTKDSPIFRSKYFLGIEKTKPLRLKSVQSLIFRILGNSEVKRVKVNKNYNIQMAHGFRKRFNTILKLDSNVNSNLAEKMLGHSITHRLDNTYFVPKVEDLFKEFKKAIPELTISEELKLKLENENKTKRITELESRDQEIEKLKARFEAVENLLDKSLKS